MSGSEIIALAAVGVSALAIIGNLVIARNALSHDADSRHDDRVWSERADAYRELAAISLLIKIIIQRTRPIVTPSPEPPPWPSEEEQRRVEIGVRLFGSLDLDKMLLDLTPTQRALQQLDAELTDYEQRRSEVSIQAAKGMTTWSNRPRHEAALEYEQKRATLIAGYDAIIDKMRDEFALRPTDRKRVRRLRLQREGKASA